MPKVTKDPLGHLDANNLKERETLPQHFIKTSNYEDVLNPETVFISGRKGDGKTALAFMLKDEKDIKNRLRYEYAMVIRNYEFYHSIALAMRENVLSSKAVYNSQIKEKIDVRTYFEKLWEYIIYITAMNTVVNDFDKYRNIEPIKEYLSSNNLIAEEEEIANNVINRVVTQDLFGGEDTILQAVASIVRIQERLDDPSFKGALNTLRDHLKKEKHSTLIVIDTLEKYYSAEEELLKAVQGMMIAVHKIKLNPSNMRIHIKCFLPDELYDSFSDWNPSKVFDGTVFLGWSYKELISLISKRYFTYIKKYYPEFNYYLNTTEIDWNNKDSVRHSFWDYFFPKQVIDHFGAKEDSFNYILRHSQRKPREIIHIVNKIINNAEKNGNVPKITEENIRVGVHDNLERLVRDNLFAHHDKLNKLVKIVQVAFANESNVLSGKKLLKCLKRPSREYRTLSLDEEDVAYILLKSGLIGIVPPNNMKERTLSDGKKIYIYETLFEYLENRHLYFNEKSICALHSMLTDSIPTMKVGNVYLFSWNNVPGNNKGRLLKYLKDYHNISLAENAEIHKSDDGKTIHIFKGENSAEIMIDEKMEKATLKISDGRTHGLKVKKENSELNIYESDICIYPHPSHKDDIEYDELFLKE